LSQEKAERSDRQERKLKDVINESADSIDKHIKFISIHFESTISIRIEPLIKWRTIVFSVVILLVHHLKHIYKK